MGWLMLSMHGIVPDPITPYVKMAQGDTPLLNELREMDCLKLSSWIINMTGSLTPYQTEANNIYDKKCNDVNNEATE